MNRTEVAIAGGGIIGLATALELAAAGLHVTVFERGRAMSESSSAAAGMLAAHDPENPPPLQPLSNLSIGLYPQFLAAVEQLSGRRIPIRTTTTIQGTSHLPHGCSQLTDIALDEFAPGLSRGASSFFLPPLRFFSLEEQSLDPRDLAEALPAAARTAGITLIENTAVLALAEHPGGVEIQTSAGPWRARHFIHCCGAWSGTLTGLPIAPRKGQMALVQSPAPLRLVLRTPEIYLVPRGEGRILIGATVEDAGFSKAVEPDAIAGLLDTAAALWPPIRNASIAESWAGLRPATADEVPVIDSFRPHCWLAAGHFRNGILLAPGTARILRQLILGEPLSIDLESFRCGRFTSSSVHS